MSAIQLTANGLALGASYALVALGFVLIVNATGAVNFAQGDLAVAGGLLTVALAGVMNLPGAVLLPMAMVAMAGFGVAFAYLAYFPLRHQPPATVFISTIALGIVLENGANGLFGAAPRLGPPLLPGGPVELSGLVLPRQSLAIVAVTCVLIAGLQIVLMHTQFGRRLRATAQDAEMARAVGIPVGAMIAWTFALATGLAGAAGMLLSNQFFIAPGDGTNLMLKAYIAVTIGGWGRVWGAVAGALIVAFFETILAVLLSHSAAEMLLYLAVLLVLGLRPRGLFGETMGRRA